MKVLPVLLVLLVMVTAACEGRRGRDAFDKKRVVKRSGIQSDSLRPHRRTKRRWVLTTFVLKENDKGPFPKIAGDLFNDQAVNMSIRYLISGPGVDKLPEIGLFSIDENTGRVYVHRPVDREKSPLFEICFDAAEKATGQIVDRSLFFNIEIEDLNDNPPVFTKSVYDINVNETMNIDNPVMQVLAQDIDKENTLNSVVTYSLLSQTPTLPSVKFTLDSKTGLLRGQGCLNYETASVFKIIVGAHDSGQPKLSSSATVMLNLQDGNDNLPVLLRQSFDVTVNEGETPKAVLRIKVEDKDAPHTPSWNAKFKIISGNEDQNYSLTTDPVTNEGILDIIQPLDFEVSPSRLIKFSVENDEPLYTCKNNKLQLNASPTFSTGTISILVADVNDAPMFNPPNKTIRQKEGLPPGTVLTKVSAKDPDKVPNKIRYTVAEDPAGWVTVDEVTGEVKTVQELDRESPVVKDNMYTIVIHGTDDGSPPQTGSSTLTLYLTDVNDNKPRLVAPYVERCEMPAHQPLPVQAVDSDQDPYSGPFTFELGDTSRTFLETWKLGKSTGDSVELSTLQDLPRGNYSVPLTILDRQGSANKEVLSVRVCFCADGVTCEKMRPASHSMGGNAIGILFGALLLLLLALCLLMCCLCSSGKKKSSTFLPNEEGNQTLIKYNEEGGSALSQASPAILFANGNGIGRGNGNNDFNVKDKDFVDHPATMQRSQPDLMAKDKDFVGHPATMQRSQPDLWTQDKDFVGHPATMQRSQPDLWTQASNAVGTAPTSMKRQPLTRAQAAQSEASHQASPALLFANGNGIGRGNGNNDFNVKEKDFVGHPATMQRSQPDLWTQASPAILFANGNGIGRGNGNNDFIVKDKDFVDHPATMQRSQPDLWAKDKDFVGHPATMQRSQPDLWTQASYAVGTAPTSMKRQPLTRAQAAQSEASHQVVMQSPGLRSQMENSSYTQNSRYMRNGSLRNSVPHAFLDRVGEMLNYRLQGVFDEIEIASYCPHTYTHEGELEWFGSMSSLSIPDTEHDLTFLDDLGSKFSTLEEICRRK